MKGTDVFGSGFLKAEDFEGHSPIVTIESVEVKKFRDGTSKPLIRFVGKEKGLICNRTNWNSIVEITGESDSDAWVGRKIRLVSARVDFQGRRVAAIRVESADQK